MAGEEGRGGDEGPSWKARIGQLVPEPGVGFFGAFLLAMVIGFLLALAGQFLLSMTVFAVAIVSILATLLTPSPAARARRTARESPPDSEETVGSGEGEVEEELPDLRIETEAAPTTARREVPAPPPEPPPTGDLVIDVDVVDAAPSGGEEGDRSLAGD